MAAPKISIIIPAHNEAQAISQVIREVRQTLRQTRKSFEILVIDDASTDQTAKIARKEKVKLFSHLFRRGSGAARKTGLKQAQGEIVVMLDADGSYDPQTILKMLKLFPKYDQVNGKRDQEKGSHPLLRQIAKWFIQTLASYLTKTKIPDLNTGLKAFKRKPMLQFLWVIPDGFSCVSTMTLAFLTNGYNVTWVPTKYRKRIGESKFHPLNDTLSYLTTVLRIIMYFNPLRIFIPLAIITFSTGVLTASYNFTNYHTIQESDIIIFVAAIFIFSLGLLADLIVVQNKREK